MSKRLKYAISVAAAVALGSSVLTNAWASSNTHARAAASKNLTVTGVLHVNKNMSVYGHTYDHNKLEVWSGEKVRTGGLEVLSGGVKTDSLVDAGPLSAQSGTFTGAVTAGTLQGTTISGGNITGTSLSVTGAGAFSGLLTASGGLTTTGQVTAGQLAAGSLQATTLTAGSLADSGALTVGGSTTFNGNVGFGTGTTIDFTHATVTGLTAPNVTNVPTLTVGNSSQSTSPLTITEGAHSNTIGLNSSGAILVSSLEDTGALAVDGSETVTGNLSVAGGSGITASQLTAPTTGTPAVPGPLTLTGSTITLTGAAVATAGLTLSSGGDLVLSSSGSTASHISAAGDADVAGTATVAVSVLAQITPSEAHTDVPFARSYARPPIITVTPSGDPAPWSTSQPKIWTTLIGSGPYTGFTIHYLAPANTLSPSSQYIANFNYHVIGS